MAQARDRRQWRSCWYFGRCVGCANGRPSSKGCPGMSALVLGSDLRPARPSLDSPTPLFLGLVATQQHSFLLPFSLLFLLSTNAPAGRGFGLLPLPTVSPGDPGVCGPQQVLSKHLLSK